MDLLILDDFDISINIRLQWLGDTLCECSLKRLVSNCSLYITPQAMCHVCLFVLWNSHLLVSKSFYVVMLWSLTNTTDACYIDLDIFQKF